MIPDRPESGRSNLRRGFAPVRRTHSGFGGGQPRFQDTGTLGCRYKVYSEVDGLQVLTMLELGPGLFRVSQPRRGPSWILAPKHGAGDTKVEFLDSACRHLGTGRATPLQDLLTQSILRLADLQKFIVGGGADERTCSGRPLCLSWNRRG